MKSRWQSYFFREMEKIALAPKMGDRVSALLGLGLTGWGVAASVPEKKAKGRLTSPGEPTGVGDTNAYQFGNDNPMQSQSVQLPYFS